MDLDAITPSQPSCSSPFLAFFDTTDANFPWQGPRPDQIRLRRSLMDDAFIFDRLLQSGGILNYLALFPPEDPQGLQQLLDAIMASAYDQLKQNCLVYFLLKWHQDGRELRFQQLRSIPPQFAALADAYWHLDTGINVPLAVSILSDARLNKDYSSKILKAISLAPEADALIRRYVHTAKPLLVEMPDVERYTLALADSSLTDAWRYSRTFGEHPHRRHLFQLILTWAINPIPRPLALTQLLSLPLSKLEESMLSEYAQKPPETIKHYSSIAVLQDLACVRLIQAGRYADAIKLDRQFTSSTPRKFLNLTRDRTRMVNEIYDALPAVDRSLLNLELDPTVPQQPPLTPKPATPDKRRAANASPFSRSLVDVHVPDALVSKPTPLRDVPIPIKPFGSTSTGPPLLSFSINTPKESLPLASSVRITNPRFSLSGAGARISFGSSHPLVASPSSGMKASAPSKAAPSALAAQPFVSADSQRNAFYEPPPSRTKTNGVKRVFEEPSNSGDVEMATENNEVVDEGGKNKKQEKRKSDDMELEDDEQHALSYSLFEKKEGKGKASIRSYDEDEEMVEDADTQPRRRTTRTMKSQTMRNSRPPAAKKARQTAPLSTMAKRKMLPGGFMDSDDDGDVADEEDDKVAPLPPRPSPPPPVKAPATRRARSRSVDPSDEGESGQQMRRRSSRLTATAARGISPEPTAPKSRKGRAAGSKKKK